MPWHAFDLCHCLESLNFVFHPFAVDKIKYQSTTRGIGGIIRASDEMPCGGICSGSLCSEFFDGRLNPSPGLTPRPGPCVLLTEFTVLQAFGPGLRSEDNFLGSPE